MKRLLILLSFGLFSCAQSYDHNLMYPDEHGGGYNLTFLGRLVNGPWHVESGMEVFNTRLFLNDSLISSTTSAYSKFQKDVIFHLHKNGTITYWLKSENRRIPDLKIENGDVVITSKSRYAEPPENFYTNGYWKADFNDSSLLIYFENKKFSDMKFKISSLSVSNASFQETIFYDSLYNGSNKKLKRVNTFYYTILYPTL